MTENNKYGHDVTKSTRAAVSFRGGIAYLLIGGGIGAAVALLFAPKTGYELRGDIADATLKGYDATLEKAIDLREQSMEAVQKIKETVETVSDFAAAKVAVSGKTAAAAVSAATGSVTHGIGTMRNELGIRSESFGSSRGAPGIL